MKTLDVLGAGVAKVKAAAAAIAARISTAPARSADPFYSDLARREALEGRQRWIRPRRGGWLR